jgi:signal transduction histidine kinase
MTPGVFATYLGQQGGALISEWRGSSEGRAVPAPDNSDEHVQLLQPLILQVARYAAEGTRDAKLAIERFAAERATAYLKSGAALTTLHADDSRLRHLLVERWTEHACMDVVAALRLSDALDTVTSCGIHIYAAQQQRVGERLIRALGHDLRNPLNAATVGAAALLRAEPLSSRAQSRLQTIDRANGRMARMIENILDVAQDHFGDGLSLTLESCDLRELGRLALRGMQAAHPERRLELSGDGDSHAKADPDRVLQALGNLVGSALERGEDPIRLDVSESSDHAWVTTSVSHRGDTSPEWLAALFDPFTPAPSGKPSGLGLYVATLIARAHGTTCEAASVAGATTLHIRWPRRPEGPS